MTQSSTHWRKGITLLSCLLWMVIMIQFSTQAWSGARTYSLLEHLLQWGSPPIAAQLTAERMAGLNYLVRKMAHITEYGLLTILAYGLGRLGFQQPRGLVLPLAWGGAALFAITDEVHQWFVPGRGASPLDVGIDLLGASLAVGLIWAVSLLRSGPQVH
ncbi:MAG: VanZ family protein [Acaryochloridaceae cyanobacterium SU_2_1]|nr:VanZ family protein [Acaryochloridaceae cyanobacterium SU_2_1]